MKRLNLLIMMFAVAMLSTSCDDNEEPTPKFKHIIEMDELIGYWQHQSTEYYSDVVTNCDELNASTKIPENKKRYLLHELNIKSLPPNEITFYDAYCDLISVCYGTILNDLDFKLFDTENKISVGGEVYQIISYNKTDKELKLKILEPNFQAVGAVVIFKKR